GIYKKAFRKIRSYWWVSIVSSAVIITGYLLFIIPGIIFSIWFIFAPFILLIEDRKGIDALLQSKAYMKGYWWAIFLRVIFMYIAVVALFGITLLGVFFRPVQVSGDSMYPNYIQGQYYLTNTSVRNLQRGDVVIFKAPDKPGTEYIKRIIGLPGEAIMLNGGK